VQAGRKQRLIVMADRTPAAPASSKKSVASKPKASVRKAKASANRRTRRGPPPASSGPSRTSRSAPRRRRRRPRNPRRSSRRAGPRRRRSRRLAASLRLSCVPSADESQRHDASTIGSPHRATRGDPRMHRVRRRAALGAAAHPGSQRSGVHLARRAGTGNEGARQRRSVGRRERGHAPHVDGDRSSDVLRCHQGRDRADGGSATRGRGRQGTCRRGGNAPPTGTARCCPT
jgi:hypothetical protein